jgi:hypothetical protein
VEVNSDTNTNVSAPFDLSAEICLSDSEPSFTTGLNSSQLGAFGVCVLRGGCIESQGPGDSGLQIASASEAARRNRETGYSGLHSGQAGGSVSVISEAGEQAEGNSSQPREATHFSQAAMTLQTVSVLEVPLLYILYIYIQINRIGN